MHSVWPVICLQLAACSLCANVPEWACDLHAHQACVYPALAAVLLAPAGPSLICASCVQELAKTLQAVSEEKDKIEQRNAVLEKMATMQFTADASVRPACRHLCVYAWRILDGPRLCSTVQSSAQAAVVPVLHTPAWRR